MIVLVLGAGTDYGLFLVFRVREELRGRPHERRASTTRARAAWAAAARDLLPRPAVGQEAIVRSVTKVGESITFSARP